MAAGVRSGRLGRVAGALAACIVLSFALLFATFASAQTNYRLTPGDVIEFDFLDDGEPPLELTIGNDGRVQAPLLGGVEIAGQTVAAATEKLRSMYIEQQYLVDPRISLSVTNFRPVFVLGDVKSPGSFPFQPHLTVEQAVGLAGGPLTVATSDAEDRILSRERLRSQIAEIEADIAHQAVWAARLSAQLDGRAEISADDIPEAARPYISGLFIETLRRGEDQILAAESDSFETQRSLLSESLAEAKREIELLEQLLTTQQTAVQSIQDELSRYRALMERGLKTASDVATLERQATLENGRILEISAQISRAHRGISDLKRTLLDFEAGRRQKALMELQDRRVEIEKLVTKRLSTMDQFSLVASSVAAAGGDGTDISYSVRRVGANGALTDSAATGVTALLPGDVVLVSVTTEPGAGANVSQ